MSITAKYIIPPSAADSNLEQYEYYLVWFSDINSIQCRLFYDYRIRYVIDKDIVNKKDANIKSILQEDTSEITLVGENLTKNEFDTIKDAAKSDNVYRIFKNGTYKKISIEKFSDEINNSNQRFNIELIILNQDAA